MVHICSQSAENGGFTLSPQNISTC